MNANIFNIQKFSIHDGPGIRTVVFFKGCPLSCIWCSNPESQKEYRQLLWDKAKCLHCLTCEKSCPVNNIHFASDGSFNYTAKLCKNCTVCIENCPADALSYAGKSETIDKIMQEVMKDKDFYEESGGGITLSGGEVLLQPKAAAALLESAKKNQLHTAIETTGYASEEIFANVIINVDLLLFDMKHYDREQHKKYTGVYNDLILKNLAYAAGQNKEIIIRIPVIPGINNSLSDAKGFCRLLSDFHITNIDLLPFHQFGQKKYEQLQLSYKMENTAALHSEDLTAYAEIFRQHDFKVKA